MTSRLVAVAAALAAANALAHPSAPQTIATYRAETRLVVLHVTVKDRRGADVLGLNQEQFTVYENGRRQPMTLFRRDDVPVSLGLLLDNSGSMRALRPRVEAAALAFVRESNPLDQNFVLNFADKPRIDVPLTSDVRTLEAGIARVDAIGGTAMRDAVELAETYLDQHGTRDRKVLLVITDGRDNASVTPLQQIQRAAERTGTAVYAVGIFAGEQSGRHELDQLTRSTGGRAYYPAGIDEIDTVVRDLAHLIRNQYTIAYAPTNQAYDRTYRRIRVEVRSGESLTAHTREGYTAAPSNDRDR